MVGIRAVTALRTRVQMIMEVLTQPRVGFGDPDQRGDDGLTHRDPGSLGVRAGAALPAAEPTTRAEVGQDRGVLLPELLLLALGELDSSAASRA